MATIPKVSIIGRKEAIAKAIKIDLRPLKELVVVQDSDLGFLNQKKGTGVLICAKPSCITSTRYAAQGPNAISTFLNKKRASYAQDSCYPRGTLTPPAPLTETHEAHKQQFYQQLPHQLE